MYYQFFSQKESIQIEKIIINVILIEIPIVIANRVSFVGVIFINRKKGSTTVSLDPVKNCSARVIIHPLKNHWDIIVKMANIQIKIRRG